jgi:putative signal transducing protein
MANTGSQFDSGGHHMPMIRLTEPQSMGELAMITSLLEGSGIPYVVQNEHMSSLYPGLPILNSSVMVDERDQVNAEMLLSRLRLEVRDVSL